MTGGTRLSEREGGKGAGWVGSGQSGPAGLPGVAQLGSWPLFFSAILFFCSEFCFEFLKKLFHSDLNKFKADHFWSLKGVFRIYKPEVL
jgi:hypothetical protein